MSEFVDWKQARDLTAVLGRAAALLEVGGWVVFPSETGPVLVARADRSSAFENLPADGFRWTLALPKVEDVAAWVGPLPAAVGRLMRRAWPGPLVFDFAEAAQSGPAAKLPSAVRHRIAPDANLPLRRPAHDAILNLLTGIDAPLALGEPFDGRSQWLTTLGESVGMVVEDGPPQFDLPATRVRVERGAWSVTEPGVYSEEELRRLTACLVLFVCTGNTCRSPMAEALFKVMLAKRLECETSELPSRGYWVMSAGVSAYDGGGAAPDAVAVVSALGADLSGHESRPVRPELAAVADYVIAMTQSHSMALLEVCPDLGTEPRLLCGDADLPDPIGCDRAVYEECAKVIQTHLTGLVAEVTGS